MISELSRVTRTLEITQNGLGNQVLLGFRCIEKRLPINWVFCWFQVTLSKLVHVSSNHGMSRWRWFDSDPSFVNKPR